MIRLSLQRGPVEVDLAEVGYPGVKLTLRRLTSPELAEARDAAVSVLMEARKGLEALAAYGLDGEDAGGRRLNPLDPHEMTRAGTLVGGVEIAMRALISWEGIAVEVFRRRDGSEVPERLVRIDETPDSRLAFHKETGELLTAKVELAAITRETLSILLLDDGLQRRIMREVEQASRLLVSEGNVSGPSPAGSSATRPVTEAGAPTAPIAGRSARRAPAEAKRAPAATARKPKAPR